VAEDGSESFRGHCAVIVRGLIGKRMERDDHAVQMMNGEKAEGKEREDEER
jgi:hypothetical protein